MSLDRTAVQDTLEKVIKPLIKDTLPKEVVLFDQLKRNDNVEEFNDTFYAPLRVGRSTGVVNLANGGSKLRTGNSSFDQASVSVKIATGTFDIQDLVIKMTDSKKKAVEAQLMRQARDLKNDFVRGLNRQYYGDGIGVIAEVAGSASGTSITVQLPSASLDDDRGAADDWYGTVNGDISPTKYLDAGMAIGIGTAGADVGTISSISGNTVNFTGSLNSNANDAIYLVDGDEAGAGTSEIQGLRAAITSGTADYAAVPRSVKGWQPVINATSEALSWDAMANLYLQAREYADSSDRFVWFMNRTLFSKYGKILLAMKKNVNETTLFGGWKGLEFQIGANGKGGMVGVMLDYDVPDGFAFLVNLDTWTICETVEMGWAQDGELLRRTDYLTYQKVFRWYTNNLCVGPGSNGALIRKTG